MPKVSVIIPSYNCARYLPEAINSVLAQTISDLEIIIIDDGSTDNTRTCVEGYISKYGSEKIIYIFQENQGMCLARNAGLRRARGEYIALLDSDDMWLPSRLEKQLAVIEKSPEIGLVHANIKRIDAEGHELSTPRRDAVYLSGWIFEEIFTRKANISTPTVFFRKKCCDAVGCFDEHMTRLGSEDRELWLRIARKYRIQYVDEVLACYRVSSTGLSSNEKNMMEGRLYIVDKHCPSNGGHPRLRDAALKKVYHDLGDHYLFLREFGSARKQYWKALTYDVTSFWTWVNLLKALFRVKVNKSG